MYYYAFTIRRLNGTDFQKVDGPGAHIEYLKNEYPNLQIGFHYELVKKENGNHNIHVHGMISSTKKVRYARLHPGSEYHFWIEPVKTVNAWNVYMTKSNMTKPEHVLDNLHDKDEQSLDDDQQTAHLIKRINGRKLV